MLRSCVEVTLAAGFLCPLISLPVGLFYETSLTITTVSLAACHSLCSFVPALRIGHCSPRRWGSSPGGSWS